MDIVTVTVKRNGKEKSVFFNLDTILSGSYSLDETVAEMDKSMSFWDNQSPAPWRYAKPGEIWLVAYKENFSPGFEKRMLAYQSGNDVSFSDGRFNYKTDSGYIEKARVVLPQYSEGGEKKPITEARAGEVWHIAYNGLEFRALAVNPWYRGVQLTVGTRNIDLSDPLITDARLILPNIRSEMI